MSTFTEHRKLNNYIPSLFHEAWFSAAIFVELYNSTVVFWMFKVRFYRIYAHGRGVVAHSFCSKHYTLFRECRGLIADCSVLIIVFNLQFWIESTLYALHCSTIYILLSSIYALHPTIYNLHVPSKLICMLYVLPATLFNLHSTL